MSINQFKFVHFKNVFLVSLVTSLFAFDRKVTERSM